MRTSHANFFPHSDRAFSLALSLGLRRIPAGGFRATDQQIRRLLRLHRCGFSGAGMGRFRAAGKTMDIEEAMRECAVLERHAAQGIWRAVA